LNLVVRSTKIGLQDGGENDAGIHMPGSKFTAMSDDPFEGRAYVLDAAAASEA